MICLSFFHHFIVFVQSYFPIFFLRREHWYEFHGNYKDDWFFVKPQIRCSWKKNPNTKHVRWICMESKIDCRIVVFWFARKTEYMANLNLTRRGWLCIIYFATTRVNRSSSVLHIMPHKRPRKYLPSAHHSRCRSYPSALTPSWQ